MAAFVKEEVTTDLLKVTASALVAAPMTLTSKSAVAPSPSPAIFLARVVFTQLRAFLNSS